MKTIHGVYAFAKIFTDTIEDYALSQIQLLCDNPAFEGCRIRVMPDVHPGKVGTIGFTSTVSRRILPQVVGIDLGCGVTLVKLKQKKAEFQKLDKVIRERVPSGFCVRSKPHRYVREFDLLQLNCIEHISVEKAEVSLGTLGGGNHFIEIDRASDGTNYLVIHTGSRNLGKQTAEIYQKLAVELNQGKEEYFKKKDALIAQYKAAGRRKEIQQALLELHWKHKPLSVPEDLCYVYGSYFEDYLHDVEICQEFAVRNRELIVEILLERTGLSGEGGFHTIHNYIDTEEMILRKGAIAAHEGEKVLIPINMRDGSVLAVGKGNQEWNYSAPHGAGRVMSRKKAKASLSMEDYEAAMEGIYTTSVNENTLDEAPSAYKSLDDIIGVIRDSVDVIEIMKPIYNFKASD